MLEIVHTIPLPWGARIEIARSEPSLEPGDPIGTVAYRSDRGEPWILRRPGGIREILAADLEIPPDSTVAMIATDRGRIVSYATAEDRIRELLPADPDDPAAVESVNRDLDAWIAYDAGDVFFWRIVHADDSAGDSAGGFYGRDEIPYMVESARGAYRAADASRAAHRLSLIHI